MSKLRAALETIEVGNGYSVFEGLQEDGSVVIKIVVDGETVHLQSLLPKSEPAFIHELPKIVSDELTNPVEIENTEKKGEKKTRKSSI